MEAENRKLDRLFREKAGNYEAQPSAGAWEAINDQLHQGETSKLIYWRVAAMLALVAGLSWIFLKQGEEVLYVDQLADHPTIELIEIPAIASVDNREPATNYTSQPSKRVSLKRVLPIAMPEMQESVRIYASRDLGPDLNRKGLETPYASPLVALQLPENSTIAVKIKYVANNKLIEKDNKKGLGNWLAKAQELKPGQLFADLRAAKNDLVASKKY